MSGPASTRDLSGFPHLGVAAAPWTIRFGLLTDPGRARERNEDACAVFVPFGGEASAARGDALFLVADGMGGHEAGDLASRLVADHVRQWFTRRPDAAADRGEEADFGEALRTALLETNRALLALAQSRSLARGAGSTATVACLRGETLHLAHVGDTRLYRLRKGELEILTRDHSWVGEQQRAGLLSDEEAETHPRRHMLTECLGVGPEVRIDLDRVPARVGDRYLLCSDGLHGPVSREAIHDALATGHDPQQTARWLVALANQCRGPDNITAVVIHLAPPLGATLDGTPGGMPGDTLADSPATSPARPKGAARLPRPESAVRRATRLLLGTAGLLLLGSAALFAVRGTPPAVVPAPAAEIPALPLDDPTSGAAARTPLDAGDTLSGPGATEAAEPVSLPPARAGVVGPPDLADTLASPSPLPGGPQP